MDDLVRLVYASEATFDTSDSSKGVVLEVGRILSESRRNNNQVAVGGVLFYGNGYFFQCLEGQREAVIDTYKRIAKDPRHTNVKILLKGFSKRRLFENWSMKYLPAEKSLRDFLAQHSLSEFSPFDFDQEMVGRLLIFFQQEKESGELAESAEASQDEAPEAETKTGWRRFFSRSKSA